MIARHDGERTVDGFRKTQERAAAHLALRKRAEAGDRAANVELFVADADFGTLTLEEGRAKAKALAPLSAEESAKVDGALAVLELAGILSKREPPGPAVVEMWKAKRLPAGAPSRGAPAQFFAVLARHAEQTKDPGLLDEVAAHLKEKHAASDDPAVAKFVEQIAERAKKLRDGG